MEKFNVDWFKKGNANLEPKYETLSNGDKVTYDINNDKFQKLVALKNSNYQILYLYNKNGLLHFKSTLLFLNNIKTGYYYDNAGGITQEIDFEKDYPFSVDDVIKQIKNDHKVDVSLSKKIILFTRWNNDSELKIPLYLISFRDDNDFLLIWNILLDGRNGNYLFQKTAPDIREDMPAAYEQYIELLKQGKADSPSQSTNKKEGNYSAPL